MTPWKMTTIAIALVTGTAFTTGLTTAYLMRPPATAEADTTATAPLRPAPMARVEPRQHAAAAPRAVPTSQQIAPATVRPAAVTTASSDCSTGSDRAWRIAKPGVLGGVLGAGLGAAGGAIANGGKGAGKGALIGGLTGVAAGGAYGAYKTKNDCGTIFGGNRVLESPPTGTAAPVFTSQQAPFAPSASDGFTVYSAR